MSDLISKKELYRKLGEAYQKGYLSWGANEVIKDIIGECDSVENEGEWIRTRTWEHDGELYCSVCGFAPYDERDCDNFCPNCGADMRGEK